MTEWIVKTFVPSEGERVPDDDRASSARSTRRAASWTSRSTWLLAVCALGALIALAGCERSSSLAMRSSQPTVAYEAQTLYEPGASRLEVSDVFDGSGRLRDPLVHGDEELWVISRERSSEGFSTAGITQDSFNLVDLLGGFASDSFAGTVIAQNPDLSIWEIVNPSGGIVGIPMDWRERRERGEEPSFIPVALKHTAVRANVSGYIATVDVQQQFHNPYSGKIEAVYVFPLPQDAAVSEFVMTIGERRIRGIIREKEEAERIYDEARSRGHVASLLSQQRPNIFTQKVANIEPGRGIDIDIRYFHTLDYEDGWYTFAFPMVVGPRFNPSGWGDPINAVGRSARPSRSGTDVHYLKPNERSGHDISLAVNLEAGVEIEEIRCNSHTIDSRATSETGASVQLAQHDSIPNRDFVLRWRVAGDRLKTALVAHRDSSRFDGLGHFSLMIYPPRDLSSLERAPVEMIFVLDCSGSMEGEPLRIAKRAVERALNRMDPRDTFSIIRFSDRVSTLGAAPHAATGENINRGLQYLRSLRADGGTHMVEGIRAAIEFESQPVATGFQPVESEVRFRDRYIVFLTDGFIGNEAEVLGVLHDGINGPHDRDDRATDSRHAERGATRDIHVFSFGIGSSPNRFLLERMAQVGNGTVAYVGLNDSPDSVMDAFIDRAAHPALESIEIDYGSMRVSDVYPSRVPDLFVGRPITLMGRFRGEIPGAVRVRGYAGERMVEMNAGTGTPSLREGARHAERGGTSNPAIAQVWARQKIAQLMSQSMTENAFDFKHEIQTTALEYGLVSAYTSFIAVDSSHTSAGDFGTTVNVPVPVPEGVKYETTVGE